MRERIQKFMLGRYGIDAFGKFLLGGVVILWILNIFMNSKFLYSWAVLLMIFAYYRMFSRNATKRYRENVKYLQIKNKVVSGFKSEKSQVQQHKTHHIYRCPTCRQKIRIPRGKGRICITCPKCKTEFTKIS